MKKNGKEWSMKWQPNIVFILQGCGFVEDVYGNNTSFNVFIATTNDEEYKFYRSAYNIYVAKELLTNKFK